ncbi:MAG TPA: hypothetical protein VH186_01365 [Chloroflexia bacterium]|nr:hypothetical protein [Chloroflexia bacterium]
MTSGENQPEVSHKAGNETGKEIEWQRWSLAENGKAGWLRAGGVLLLVALIVLVLLLSLTLATALVLSAALMLALLPYFLPRQYRVSESGIVSVRGIYSDRHDWTEFRAYRAVEGGFWLLAVNPLEQPVLRRAPLKVRDLFLPTPVDLAAGEELEAIIAARLQKEIYVK